MELEQCTVETALGPLTIVGNRHVICHIAPAGGVRDAYASVPHGDAPAKWAAAVSDLAAGQSGDVPPFATGGSVFQQRVWSAICAIPRGQTRSYAQLAASIGAPRAVRAVGGACAANPVPLLIPCHRVVPATGGAGRYAWGEQIKVQLLASERLAQR